MRLEIGIGGGSTWTHNAIEGDPGAVLLECSRVVSTAMDFEGARRLQRSEVDAMDGIGAYG